MKNCKTFYETQTASRLKEIILQPPIPPDKTLLRFWNKNFFREIYRNIQTFAFKVLQESSSWVSGNGAVQSFFSDTKQKHVCWKICKLSFLAVFWEHIILKFQRAEIRKKSQVFWTKLYCKMSDLSRCFLLALRFTATNSGIKKLWLFPLEFCISETIFSIKRITNMKFWIL